MRRALLPIALAVVLAAPAQAADKTPPIKDGVTCTMSLQESYRLAKVKRRGLPIDITCTGPARFFAMPQFSAMTPQDANLAELYPNGTPNIARVSPTSMDAAGTVTVRPRFTRTALRIMGKYKKTKLLIGMATLREDGSFWSEPGDWDYARVVR